MNEDIYTSGEYFTQNPKYHIEDSPVKAAQILKMMRKHTLKCKRICDVGCGVGEVLRLVQTGLPGEPEAHGYEISPQAFEFARERANGNLRFFNEVFVPSAVTPYDLLLCIDVFEHVEDYFGFLKDLKRGAEYKIFNIPLDMCVRNVSLAWPILEARNTVGHLHYFSKETALRTLVDTGYKVIDHFYAPSSVYSGTSLKSRAFTTFKRALYIWNADLTVRLFGGYSLVVLAR